MLYSWLCAVPYCAKLEMASNICKRCKIVYSCEKWVHRGRKYVNSLRRQWNENKVFNFKTFGVLYLFTINFRPQYNEAVFRPLWSTASLETATIRRRQLTGHPPCPSAHCPRWSAMAGAWLLSGWSSGWTRTYSSPASTRPPPGRYSGSEQSTWR